MNLKIFTTELVKEWQKTLKEKRAYGLGVPAIVENKDRGLNGEKTVLQRLRNDFGPKYKFTVTDNSWSPADIIGFKKDPKFWHFALYQVKTSIYKEALSEKVIEKETLPELAKLLKKVFVDSDQTKRYKKKPVYITIGYVGVHHSKNRNRIIRKIPYQKTFTMNGLSLSPTKKTEIKNQLHR
jgi:hypothetical protein